MHRRLAIMIGLAAVGLLLVGACSSDSTRSREEMIDNAVEGGLDEATATCLVDGLLDEFGAEQVDEMELAEANEDIEDLSEEEQAALTEVTAACLDLADLGEGPGVSIDPDVTDTTATE